MLFHLEAYHFGSCDEEFVKNVQLAMKKLYIPSADRASASSVCRDVVVKIRSADSASASSTSGSDWVPIETPPGLTPPPPPPYNNPPPPYIRDLLKNREAPREVS